MATLPSPKTWATNDGVGASTLNLELRDLGNFLLEPPRVALTAAGQTHTSTGNFQAVGGYTEEYDSDAMHSTVTNTSRITCVTPGVYMFSGWIEFASNATGIRALRFLANSGTVYYEHSQPAAAGAGAIVIAGHIGLLAAQFVELQGYQSSGGNLGINNVRFTAMWVSKS